MRNLKWIMSGAAAWPLLIAALALIVRLAYLAIFVGPGYAPELDAAEYSEIATSLANGRGFVLANGDPTAIRPPLYPLLLAGVYGLAGRPDYQAGLLLQVLLGAGIALAVYAAGRLAFDELTGRLAGIGAALYPLLVYAGGALLSEPLFVLLVTLVMVASLALLARPSLCRHALVGLLLGLAWLARPTGLMLTPFVLIWWLAASQTPWRQRLVGALAIGLITLAVVSPWIARNAFVFRAFIPASTMGGAVLFGSNNALVWSDPALQGDWVSPCEVPGAGWTCALGEVERDAAWRALGLAFIRAHLADLPAMIGWRQVKYWHLYPFEHGFPESLGFYAYVAVVLLAVIGAWLRRQRWRQFGPLAAVILCFAAGSLLFWGGFRMRLPAEPALIMLAAAAVAVLFRLSIKIIT